MKEEKEHSYTRRAKLLVVVERPSEIGALFQLSGMRDVGDWLMITSYAEALRLLKKYRPDLCLIDVNLEGTKGKGLELARAARVYYADLPVIFITESAREAWHEQCCRLPANGLLSKSSPALEYMTTIDTVLMARHQTVKAIQQQAALEAEAVQENYFFKVGDVYKQIHADDIAFFYAQDKLIYAKVKDRSFPTSIQLKVLEGILPEYFLRIHKSYLVNLHYMDEVKMGEGLVFIQDAPLPLGYTYRENLLEKLQIIE
jgi:DNA-binding LytR/AlgR family response regulator